MIKAYRNPQNTKKYQKYSFHVTFAIQIITNIQDVKLSKARKELER